MKPFSPTSFSGVCRARKDLRVEPDHIEQSEKGRHHRADTKKQTTLTVAMTTPSLAKNPRKGGTPAMENISMPGGHCRTGFERANPAEPISGPLGRTESSDYPGVKNSPALATAVGGYIQQPARDP